MLTLLNLVYVLPVVIALIIAGVMVNGRLAGSARTLMWSGIALTCLTRLVSLFTPYLVMNRGFTQLYGVVNIITAVLGAVGVVLLVAAIGAAAVGFRPAIGQPASPGQPGWPQNQPGQPAGFGPPPGAPGRPDAGYGQSGPGHGRPVDNGQWTAPGQWGNQP